MPVTTVDPNIALIVIDLQKGIARAPLLRPLQEVVAGANKLIDAFHRHGLPVVLVVVEGSAPGRTEQPRRAPREYPADFADLLPEIRQGADDHLVRKRTPGAFTCTDLEAHLRGAGVTQVVIAGVATSSGVESTARQAYELGFNVTVAIDAIGDTQGEAEAYSLWRVFPRLAETGPVADIVALIEQGRAREGHG